MEDHAHGSRVLGNLFVVDSGAPVAHPAFPNQCNLPPCLLSGAHNCPSRSPSGPLTPALPSSVFPTVTHTRLVDWLSAMWRNQPQGLCTRGFGPPFCCVPSCSQSNSTFVNKHQYGNTVQAPPVSPIWFTNVAHFHFCLIHRGPKEASSLGQELLGSSQQAGLGEALQGVAFAPELGSF